MKSVIISNQPQWCELIASGAKKIEVRKSAPKEVPFKAYIYQSKWHWIYKLLPWLKERRQKVIGEFICDKVYKYNTSWLDGEDRLKEYTCLEDVEIMDYMNNYTDRWFYGWHITDLKIYDKPKKLGEFRKVCVIKSKDCANCEFYSDYSGTCINYLTRPPQSWQYVEEL